MTQTITIPNPPTSKEDAIACYTALGQALKVAINTGEENVDAWFPGKRFAFGIVHFLLNTAGYKLEDATGVPDETYGAGGSNKSGGGGG